MRAVVGARASGDVAIVSAVAVGGAIGAVARYTLTVLFPAAPGQIPWATVIANVSGCFLIGILMVLVTEVWSAHPVVRPFLGVGILGGYTTFSTYAVEIRQLVADGDLALAFGYLAGTVLAALAAVLAGLWVTRLAVGGRNGRGT